MFANVTKKLATKKSVKGEKYVPDEVLAILDLAERLTDPESGKTDRAEISRICGRTEYSLGYKIFERQTTIKGVTSCRSIMRFMYLDHKTKDSDMVDTETFLRRLYVHFKIKAPETFDDLKLDIQARVASWQKVLLEREAKKEADAKAAAEKIAAQPA